MKFAAAIMLLVVSELACGAEWHCRNNDVEITCGEKRCKASDAFTPVDVSVGGDGQVSVCAYSGCWEGKGRMFSHGTHLVVSAHGLRWNASGKADGDFIVGIDRASGIAVLNGHGYAMPLVCERNRKDR